MCLYDGQIYEFMGLPLEFGIGVHECFYDGAIRWSKKFSDTFSRFDTIPAVTDSQPASQPATQPASHVAVAITLNAKASSLKSVSAARRISSTWAVTLLPGELDGQRQHQLQRNKATAVDTWHH